jgi:hypothetical protein
MNPKRNISPVLYYIFVSLGTYLTFLLVVVVLAVAGFALFSIPFRGHAVVWGVFLLIWSSVVAVIPAWFWSKKTLQKEKLISLIGMYLGLIYGTVGGGILGARISNSLILVDSIGFTIGAMGFYYIGRWVGPKLSSFFDSQLNRVFSPLTIPVQELTTAEEHIPRGKLLAIIIIGIIFPLMLVDVGYTLIKYDMSVGFPPELMPIFRTAAILLSIIAISYPWLLKDRFLNKIKVLSFSNETSVFLIGIFLSISPVVCGFNLFHEASGAIEFGVYATLSSLAVISWGTAHLLQAN